MPSATVTSKGQITSGGEAIVESEPVDIRSLKGMLKHHGRRVSLQAMERAIRRGASGGR